MATSFLQPLKVQGGTFYTFASAAKDLSKTFTDDNARFVFSKYALLELPPVQTPASGKNDTMWQALDALSGTSDASGVVANGFNAIDNNFNFAQAFQSYTLNFEQLVLSSSNNLSQAYDEAVYSTTSERIWWHFLKNINAIRWEDANTTNQSNIINRYTEETPTGSTYSYTPIVKYLGDIELINSISKGGQSYSEIYIHVPTSHGNTPLVLFKTLQDKNYAPGMIWTGTSQIYGRAAGVSPFGLNNNAFFDNGTSDTYILGATFGNVANTGSTAYIGGTPYTDLQISNMDGAVLDFDPSSYNPITKDAELNTIGDFNASSTSSDFKFNTCLVYYDTYDVSNPQNFARNLYGVLILDDYENGSLVSTLKGFNKFKPNPITKLNGNSYGLKLNLKFDTSSDTVGVETVIREDLTFGMDLFSDASVRLQESADMFIDQKLENIKLENRVTSLEQYYFNQEDMIALEQQVKSLQTTVSNTQTSYAAETTLLDLIRLNSSDIDEILSGKVNVNLTYNTDVIQPGSGITIDQSVQNQVSIENKVENYYTFSQCGNTSGYLDYGISNGMIAGSTANGNKLILGQFTNYFRNAGATQTSLLSNLVINIDDSQSFWKNGQTLRIVFNDIIDVGAFQINIKTDATNRMSGGNYGRLCGSLTVADLVTTKPIIEIICTNENNYSFNIDVIK